MRFFLGQFQSLFSISNFSCVKHILHASGPWKRALQSCFWYFLRLCFCKKDTKLSFFNSLDAGFFLNFWSQRSLKSNAMDWSVQVSGLRRCGNMHEKSKIFDHSIFILRKKRKRSFDRCWNLQLYLRIFYIRDPLRQRSPAETSIGPKLVTKSVRSSVFEPRRPNCKWKIRLKGVDHVSAARTLRRLARVPCGYMYGAEQDHQQRSIYYRGCVLWCARMLRKCCRPWSLEINFA